MTFQELIHGKWETLPHAPDAIRCNDRLIIDVLGWDRRDAETRKKLAALLSAVPDVLDLVSDLITHCELGQDVEIEAMAKALKRKLRAVGFDYNVPRIQEPQISNTDGVDPFAGVNISRDPQPFWHNRTQDGVTGD